MALGVHALLVGLFAWTGHWPLVAWNVLSVLVFGWAIRSHAAGAYQRPGVPVFGEMLGHAALCVALVGTAPGFHYYLLVNVVIPFLVPFWSIRTKLVTASGYALALAILEVWGLTRLPPDPLPGGLEVAVLAGNSLGVALVLVLVAWAYDEAVEEAEAALEEAWADNERLVLDLLPASVAERLRARQGIVADRHEEVGVLFADLAGFTELSGRLEPERVVEILNRIFSAFDEEVGARGLEKVKTIGDAYMVVGGAPDPRPGHGEALCRLGLAMQRRLAEMTEPDAPGLALRIGIHSGPLVAGVLGTRRLAWDVWGDTVNMAARLEETAPVGRVQVSDVVREHLSEEWRLEPAGLRELRGIGPSRAWLLTTDPALEGGQGRVARGRGSS